MKNFQSFVSEAAIRALDEGAERIGKSGEKAVHRLAKKWRSFDADEKRELIEVVVAIGGALTVAVAAVLKKGPKKKKATKAAKKAGRAVLEKVVGKGSAKSLLTTKKK